MTAASRRWATALVLAGAMFLVLFDSLAVATALPAVGAEFRLAPAVLQWVVTLYSLSIAGLLLLGGRVCDLWGRRRLVIGSLLLATAGSVLAGLAPGLGLLLAGRVMQGVAAALAIPAALASAATLFPDEPWRSRVFTVVAVAANTAGLVGAVCGGLVADRFGWRWVFLCTVPFGLVAAAGAIRLLPADPPAAEGERLDLAGAALATAGLVSLIYGVSTATGPAAVLPIAAGVGFLALLARRERRVPTPLIRPALLRSRRLIGSCVAFGLHSAAYAVVVVVGSLYLQDVFGLSSAGAGLVLAPVLLGAIAGAAPAGALIRRYGPRRVVAAALGLCAASLALIAASGSLVAVVVWSIAWGLSAGPIYVGLTRECIGDAAEADRGMASALFESTTHIGGAVAVAVYLTLLGAGAGYGLVQVIGAAAVGAGVVTTLAILPRTGVPARR